MLRFNARWRFAPPAGYERIGRDVQEALFALILRVAAQGDRKDIIEGYKSYFANAAGVRDVSSSDVGWAETDLRNLMDQAGANAPMFIEAFFDAGEALRDRYAVPETDVINEVLSGHHVPFRIEPPNLVTIEGAHVEVVIDVPARPATLAEDAIEILQASLQRSEELLADSRDREAVGEILWLLESVSTAFRGLQTGTGTVGGTYFNQIVRELRAARQRPALDQILNWLTTMHGYLSAPAGGGVRHGLDLNRGIQISHKEARLYCNLVRSYITYLLAEHEEMTVGRGLD